MTADEYLEFILKRETVDHGLLSPLWAVQKELTPLITEWANGRLLDMHPSGSYAKGTCNASGTDIDLFISLEPATVETLEEIHNKLFNRLTERGYAPARQNVSINVKVLGQSVDLVPGKLQNYLCADHALYRRRAQSWTKTNVQTHIDHVRNSGMVQEMRVLKLWRDQKGLDFPSFYLELTVMKALAAKHGWSLSDNVWTVLEYLRDSFASARVVDPANTNNVISDDLTVAGTQEITVAARSARNATSWGDIVR
jgi:hypothetical protein